MQIPPNLPPSNLYGSGDPSPVQQAAAKKIASDFEGVMQPLTLKTIPRVHLTA